jgi:hypothetical protein
VDDAQTDALGELLRERSVLSEEDCHFLDDFVERHIRQHGGLANSLASLRVDADARRDLSQLPDADVQSSLTATPGGLETPPPPVADTNDLRTVPPASEETRPNHSPRYRRLRLRRQTRLGEFVLQRA